MCLATAKSGLRLHRFLVPLFPRTPSRLSDSAGPGALAALSRGTRAARKPPLPRSPKAALNSLSGKSYIVALGAPPLTLDKPVYLCYNGAPLVVALSSSELNACKVTQ